ncbi:MAG TPA: SapC family protein [Ramlibacter sp.]|nr:SapC family protein [Ramlibacter sp.]
MSDSVYFEKPALLDREKHRKSRVASVPGFGFARKSNSLYLAGVEFAEACKEYPIVFTRMPNRKTLPVAMLGLRSAENLFVDAQDRWTATYIPAFVRCYPFVLTELPGQSMAVCVDEAFPGLNETDGQPLFDAQGNNTPFLQNALDFLTRYQQEYRRTELLCERLEQAGLFKQMDAKADLADGRTFTVSGLLVIDEQKLMALPDAQVLALFRTGELHLVSMHLLSLSNMKQLVDRMAQHKSAPPGAPATG